VSGEAARQADFTAHSSTPTQARWCQAGCGGRIMLIAHKIALDPNNVQATYFARAAGTARFAYNWALAEWQRQYEASRI